MSGQQQHLALLSVRESTMADSDAESYRIAGRYIADLGNGASLTLSAMFENVEYEFKNVTTPGAALQDFGFASSSI